MCRLARANAALHLRDTSLLRHLDTHYQVQSGGVISMPTVPTGS